MKAAASPMIQVRSNTIRDTSRSWTDWMNGSAVSPTSRSKESGSVSRTSGCMAPGGTEYRLVPPSVRRYDSSSGSGTL